MTYFMLKTGIKPVNISRGKRNTKLVACSRRPLKKNQAKWHYICF